MIHSTRLKMSTLLLLLTGTVTFAQTTDSSTDLRTELSAAHALIQTGRETVIAEEMHFTSEEEKDFWPLYEEYNQENSAVQDRYAQMVADYVTKYYDYTLTDTDAEDVLDDYFDIQSELLRIQRKYVRKFERIMPPKKVMRFYQLQNKITAEINAALAVAIPLADPS